MKIEIEKQEEKIMRNLDENIIAILRTFGENVDFAFEIGEADGTFARDHALDEAWRIFDEDIDRLDLSSEAVEVLNIVALDMVK